MVTQKDGGLVARSVREALGTLVSPQVYAQLVARALQTAGLSEIPERGPAIARWIQGALLREVETAVGPDAAELVATQLSPIVAHASANDNAAPRANEARSKSDRSRRSSSKASPQRTPFASDVPTGVMASAREQLTDTARVSLTREQLAKLRDPDAGHTSRPQASEEASSRVLPRILVASSAGREIDALVHHLERSASVTPVSDLVGLLDTLDEPGLNDPIVLLDCLRPTVHVTSIAAIGEDLPRNTTIVLWGASDEAWNELDRERAPNCKWVRCSHEATTADVGTLCAALLGQR
jgi:hypothetical protein